VCDPGASWNACAGSVPRQRKTLASCDGQVKTAFVAGLAGISPEAARRHLAQANDAVRAALNIIGN
jgi:N-acetylmuramic acid 6-phosphate (MurNAc-6-P) etherase